VQTLIPDLSDSLGEAEVGTGRAAQERMDQPAQASDSPVKGTTSQELASLPLARAYIQDLRESISSLHARRLIDALERLDAAYREFPELELDHPRRELLEAVRSAAANMSDRAAIPLLIYCVALDASCSRSAEALLGKIAGSDSWPSVSPVFGLLCRSGQLRWSGIRPVVNALRQQGRAAAVLQLVSAVLDYINFTKEDDVSELEDILKFLLGDGHGLELNWRGLADVARSARHRLSTRPSGRYNQPSRELLLGMAERLRATPSSRWSNSNPEGAWPSGRLSFDEFLLQWPCEIELPVDLDEAAFIDEAYRAILLRGPDVGEKDQYLRLLQNRVVSKPWIIEDLLASEERRSLERRLRVILGRQMITEPGNSGEEDMPAVVWPWQPAS
jgi:hypothetical protein